MRRIVFAIIFTCAIFGLPMLGRAASMSVYFENNLIEIGKEFSVSLKIDSEGANINAAQATLVYPKDILEIKSVDKSGSVFNFWLEEPQFDNVAGKLSFIGGAPAGYSGKSLQVFIVNFRAKSAGKAVLNLTDGAIASADGSGANVLSKLRGAELLVAPKSEIEALPPPSLSGATTTVSGTKPIALPLQILPKPVQITRAPVKAREAPAAPKLEVPLYPDPLVWHNIVANFLARWTLPADVSDVATAVSRDPKFNPARSEGLFDNKFFPALPDGISYLHVRFKNNAGWGETAHFRMMIDTSPPSGFSVKMEGTSDSVLATDNPSPALLFESNDQLSGIDRYVVQVDSEKAIETKDARLILPLLKPGEHIVKASARDLAGNSIASMLTIKILPIESPLITGISRDVFVNEGNLNLSGTTLSGASVIVIIKRDNGEVVASKEVPSDGRGNWAVKFDEPIKRGIYFAEVTAKDSRGALSLPVKSEAIRVKTKPIATIGGIEITETWFFIGLILVLLIGFGAGYLTYHLWREQMGRRVTIARRDVVGVLGAIDKDLDRLLKNYSDKTIDEREAEEMYDTLQRIKTRAQKMSKYLSQAIEEIKD